MKSRKPFDPAKPILVGMLIWVALVVLALLGPYHFSTWAGEQIDLTTPDQAVTGTPSYYIARLDEDWDGARVTIYLNSSVGLKKVLVFTGTDAINYMKTTNKGNYTVTSRQKWTLNQLVTKGYLAGTVSGTPD